MNFISTFDELNKLYESTQQQKAQKDAKGQLNEYYDEECPNGRSTPYSGSIAKSWGDPVPQWWLDSGKTAAQWRNRDKSGYRHDEETGGDRRDRWTREDLSEDSDEDIIIEDEIPTEEVPAEEAVVEDEPRQVICECDKCGALVIKDEADIVIDEESDLVNVEDECQFCEEAKGFKIVGVVAPYEVTVEEEPAEEVVEESLNNSALLKEIEKTNELKTEHESEYLTLNEEAEDIIDEDLADVYRKKLDKPASIKTQQAWEAELNGEMGEISDKRRKHLERKFAQQRDWEERHPDKEVKY